MIERIVMYTMVTLLILLIPVVILVVVYEANSPTITIRKDEWKCTETVYEMRWIGKTAAPLPICHKYERIE